MKTFNEFINESAIDESHNAVEIPSVKSKELMGKDVKSIIRKGSKIWKKLNGGKHKINHEDSEFIPCEVVKIEKKKNKKTNKVDIWISVKSKDDKGKETYFYDWASGYMNALD